MKTFPSLICIITAMISCSSPQETTSVSDTPSRLYFGGDIITMEGEEATYAEAVVEQEGKIVFVGTEEDARAQFKGSDEHNLAGKTLIPGFIDGHAHFMGFGAQAVGANLLSPPDGTVQTIDDLVEELKKFAEGPDLERTGWIFGMGYDDAVLAEGRHPTKDDLDKVSTELPVLAVHISGHFSAVNSVGLEMIGYDANTPDPEGGKIRREAGSKEPNGVLEELASIPTTINVITPKTAEDQFYFLKKAQELATRFGYTTAQEGRAFKANHEAMAAFADSGKFEIDIVSYIDYVDSAILKNSPLLSKNYKNHYRIGGMKITLDGSPQGRTAWRTEPYLIPPDGQEAGYMGYPVIPDNEMLNQMYDMALSNGWQVLTHANGDAAIDQFIHTIGPAIREQGSEDHRAVLIHGQFVRQNQLDSLAKLNIMPSLFPMHTFYWGDWYDQIIGPEKAQQISPMRSVLDRGMKATSHTDAPVALPNLINVMSATVNRSSRSGKVMGADEKLTPYEALKTITIWGAYQHFEENSKGSIKEGKLADFVILNKNPLKVDPMNIKDIQVLETIKEGKTVYN